MLNNANVEPRLQLAPVGFPQTDERRTKTRYAIELAVRFIAQQRTSPSYNIGRTINISSSGLLVASPYAVRDGEELRLMIEWPWPLDGRVPLQLVASGTVVWFGNSRFAVKFRSYQFRTMNPKLVRASLSA